ncbi:MAG: c-type cytochrome [Alphaproteobacteria bacterium]
MKKNKYLILLILFPFYISANDIQIDVIIENCKSCHGQNYEGNKYIKSLKGLEKQEFISIMNEYLYSNDDHVMTRISKVLNKKDIMKMAEKIYEKVQ